MLNKVIQWSGRNPFLVLLATLFIVVGGVVALLKDLKPGAPVAFEFVERQPGEWVVTSISTAARTGAAR